MIWRRAKKALTADEERQYQRHRIRLLNRHWVHLTPSLMRCLEANASRLARHPELLTREWGLNMRGKRAAKAAHAAVREKGRTPGDKGRAAIARNREQRRQQRDYEAFMQVLSQADPKKQNKMILQRKQAEEQARVERLAQEWQAKLKRLNAPRNPARDYVTTVDSGQEI